MSVSSATMRVILRWVHVVLGLVILCYIYSPWHRYVPFQVAVKFLVIPILVMSGIWLWKFPQFNKFFGIKNQ